MDKNIVVTLSDAGIFHADNPNVTLTQKNKYKEGEKILEDVNLEVREGELVYLIGRIGSGKSSLLKTLYGELPLVEGEGEIADFDLTRLKQRDIPYLRRKVSMVFQDNILLSDSCVYENLLCVLQATGWKKSAEIEARTSEVLALVGLEGKEKRMPFELSGGEQQRLIIARALLNSPEVILADEPTANLDPVTADGIIALFHNIAANGTAVIMSTHNTALVERYPSRTLLFAQNTIREVKINIDSSPKSSI